MSKSRNNITVQACAFVDWHEYTFVKTLGNKTQAHHVDITEKNRKADKDYTGKTKSRDYFAKEEKEADKRFRSLITHSEIASLENMRVYHPANPKIRHGLVTDDKGQVTKSVVLSRGIEQFRTLSQAIEDEGGIAKTLAKINKNEIFKNLGVTMALSIFHKDTDPHMRNVGEDGNHVAVRIDGDWCNARLRLKTGNYNRADTYNFNITPQLIESLPTLTNYHPYNWFDQVRGSEHNKSYPFIQGLDQANLRRDIFKTFLGLLITPNEITNKINGHQCYIKEDADSLNLEHMTSKLELLTAALQSPSFIHYLQSKEADEDYKKMVEQLENHRLALNYTLTNDPARMREELELRLQKLRELSLVDTSTKEWQKKLVDTAEVDVNLKNVFGETALMIAVQDGNKTAFDVLVAKGADVLVKNDDGESGLVYAARYNQTELFNIFLKRIDQYPNKQEQLNKALLGAAANNNTYIVQALLDNGAALSTKASNSRTPLHIAAAKGHVANMQLLLANGAILDEATAKHETPLMLAALHGHANVVKFIIETGLVTQYDLNNAFLWAASADSAKCIELLIKAGAQINVKDGDGKSALFIAAEGNKLAAMKELLKHKVDVSALNNYGYNPLTIAARTNQKEAVDLILKNTDPTTQAVLANQPNYEGDNALAKAIKLNHVDMVEKLFTINGINIDAKNKSGKSALNLALSSTNFEILQKFVKAGLSINMVIDAKSGDTLLHRYTKTDNDKGVDFCLLNKANVNAVNADEKTPLMIATMNANTVIMSNLLQVVGIDTEAKDKNGNTALILAVMNNDHHAVDALLDGGASTAAENNTDRTALLIALEQGHHKCTVELLEAGAELEDIEDIDEYKFDSFIQYALSEQKYGALFQLLNSCNQLDRHLISDMTLMRIAHLAGDKEMVEKIKQNSQPGKEFSSSASQIYAKLDTKPSMQPEPATEVKKPVTENDSQSLVMSPRTNQLSDMDSPKKTSPKKH